MTKKKVIIPPTKGFDDMLKRVYQGSLKQNQQKPVNKLKGKT